MSDCNKSSVNKNVKTKTLQAKSEHQLKTSDLLKNEKLQQKSEQLRNTNILSTKEDTAWQERIKQVMDLTQRSEDEVIMALHDSDGDLDRAVNDLLEGVSPEWEVKKKKARQSGGPKPNFEHSDISDNNTDWDNKYCSHNDGQSRIRGRSTHTNRGWRRRENKENEKNIQDIKLETSHSHSRRGRGILARSGRGGRGGGRGIGPRTFANRGKSSIRYHTHSFTHPIETWTGSEEQRNNFKKQALDSWSIVTETNEDWDNEEYTGSLADTKVFTPSTLLNEVNAASDKHEYDEISIIKPLHSSALLLQSDSGSKKLDDIQTNDQTTTNDEQQSGQQLINITSRHLPQSLDDLSRGTLSAAQTEYLTQLTQQATEGINAATGQTTFLSVINSQPQRQSKHRPRVPPPSKIPSTAVEMPGDALNSSISFLDVQFGALEFGSDAGINDGSNLEKYNTPVTNSSISGIESSSISTKTVVNSISSVNVETEQSCPSQKFNATKMLRGDNQCISNENTVTTQSGFTNRNNVAHSSDVQKQDLIAHTSLNNSTAFNATVTYQSPKTSYPTSVTASNYNSYSCNVPENQTPFSCSSTNCKTNSFSAIAPATQTGYNSYTQSNMTTFSQTSPSSNPSSVYNQTPSTSQGYQSTTGYTTTSMSQYQSQSTSTNASSNNSAYINAGFQNPSTFQSTTQAYQQSNATFVSSVSQGSTVYSNTVQSVYSHTYPSYGCQNQSGSQDHKLSTNKDLHFDSNSATSSTAIVTTASSSLGLNSNSINVSQTKTTVSSAVPKCSITGLVPSSSNNSSSISGSGTTGNVAPMLSHQYIMGQSVPYATFQQPHMYSYEDLQLMQQRMPHMPTTGYYDATLGYQTTGPVTSLGNSRTDALSGVQGVQGVQTVQGQYTSINDARFTRSDSNSSPVSSTISQQTATQHQQPLMNPIPPGYAYFYGGSILPAGSFQYGTPAIYPQIATASSAGTATGGYSAKPGSYGSGYGSGNYDSITSSGPSTDYKNATTGYTSNQTGKSNSSNVNTNTSGTSTDINTTMYTKGHVALSKVNSYEKQTFHSATPPPFGLTNNQNANVISGYGPTHLFIPTVPHQLHQPLHQDNGSGTGQRNTANSQNKPQVKSGYSTSYWAGGN